VSTLLDGQFGMKVESTPNTPVTPDRFYEVLADSSHNWDPMPLQGVGLRVGSTYPRSARRIVGVGKGEFTVKAELQSKGFGVLLGAVSTATSTNVAGATYQQLCTSVLTATYRSAYTCQFGVPRTDGTVDAYTYAGCVPTAFEIDAPERGIPTISVSWWAQSLATATALATASYSSSPTTYSDSASAAGTTFGGTITAPTSTALASGGTASSNIRSWTLSVDLGVNERPALGSWQRPTFGAPSATLKVVQDYDATTTRALQISQGATSFTGYYTGAALSTGVEGFYVVVPTMKLDDGALGQLTAGEGSVPDVTFTVLDDLTNAAWYMVSRTADTAL